MPSYAERPFTSRLIAVDSFPTFPAGNRSAICSCNKSLAIIVVETGILLLIHLNFNGRLIPGNDFIAISVIR
jgi:hypothetical protein